MILMHYRYKFGISIPVSTEIGFGFYIGHIGNIVISGRSKIGNNCNISHGVTIGRTNRGKYPGAPIIGDNVYIAPGAKVIGKITIGNNAAIGANAVVVESVPDNAVVVGIPGKVISFNGSQGYIHNAWKIG
jgi:serine O-acetyltransferase